MGTKTRRKKIEDHLNSTALRYFRTLHVQLGTIIDKMLDEAYLLGVKDGKKEK